jgi:hypothetical protein
MPPVGLVSHLIHPDPKRLVIRPASDDFQLVDLVMAAEESSDSLAHRGAVGLRFYGRFGILPDAHRSMPAEPPVRAAPSSGTD